MNLTFKEYIASKEILKISIKNDPIKTVLYEATTYCKLPHGENRAERTSLRIRPHDTISVVWNYKNRELPTYESISINDSPIPIYWTNDKFVDWLGKNGVELP